MAGIQQVAARSPGLALVASFFVPGLGSLMYGQVRRGLVIMACWGVAVFFAVISVGILFFLPLAVLIWAMVDAYRGAQRWNREHGIIS